MADKGWLVLGEVRGLDLEGRVLNRHREVTGHAFAYLVQHLRGMPVGEALILDHHMRGQGGQASGCLLYTSPSPRDKRQSRMPSSA